MPPCELLVACSGLYSDVESCVTDCIEWSATDSPECEAATIAWNLCVGTASCRDLSDTSVHCPDETAARVEACSIGPLCAPVLEGDAELCILAEDCPDEARWMMCSDGACHCYIDALLQASCDDPDQICAEPDLEAASVKLLECCGWVF